jgi:ribose transport system permease protein
MKVGPTSSAETIPGAGVPGAGDSARESFGHRAGEVVAPYGVLIALLILIVVFSITLPDTFPTSGNFNAMVTSQGTLLIMALGLTCALRAGDFDLSIGSVMIFSSAVVAVLTTQHHVSVPVAVVLAVCAGTVIGLINGVLIVIIGLDGFVVTLAAMSIVEGLAFAVTNNQVVTGLPNGLLDLSRHTLFTLPYGTYYGWILAIVLWYIYEQTPLGRYHLVVGQSRNAATLAGLPVRMVRILGFVGASTICALAGVLLAGTLGAVDPTIGPQFLLQPFAAAFLGATTIKLGQFNVLGTVVGLYLLIVGVTGLQLIGVPPWVSDVFNGGALLLAILLARVASRKAFS